MNLCFFLCVVLIGAVLCGHVEGGEVMEEIRAERANAEIGLERLHDWRVERSVL